MAVPLDQRASWEGTYMARFTLVRRPRRGRTMGIHDSTCGGAALALACGWSIASFAATITVSPGSSIQSAVNSASAGSTITVLAGKYDEQLNLNKPLTLQAQGKVETRAIVISAANVTVRGFDVTNVNATDPGGINVHGDNCLVEDNYVHETAREGIYINSDSTGCVVRNNRIYKADMAGIAVDGVGNTVEGNEIWYTLQYGPLHPSTRTGADADGIRYFGSGHLIRGNHIHDIPFGIPENQTPHIDCFQTFGGASSVTIERNVCDNFSANVGSTEGTQGAELEQATDIVIRNNYFHTYAKKIDIGASTTNTRIEDNIFVGGPIIANAPTQYGIFVGDGPGTTARNNLFFDIHINNGTALIYGVLTSNQSGNLLNVDPQLDATFHPLTGSPVCGAGLDGGDIGVYTCGSIVPLPTVTLAAPDGTASEPGSDAATVEFVRSGSLDGPLVVAYGFSGTASAGVDFTPQAGTVTIPSSATSAMLTVTPMDDALLEGTESIVVSVLPQATYALGSSSQVSLRLLDDEAPLPEVSVVVSRPEASENGPTDGAFTFRRSGTTAAPLAVSFVASGTATPGVDYLQLPGSVTFAAGQSSVDLTVTPIDDAEVDEEQVILSLSESPQYVVGVEREAALVIADDDGPGPADGGATLDVPQVLGVCGCSGMQGPHLTGLGGLFLLVSRWRRGRRRRTSRRLLTSSRG